MFKGKKPPELGRSRYRVLYRRARTEVSQRLDPLLDLLNAKDDTHEHEAWLRSRWRGAIVNMIDSGLPAGSRYHLSRLTILFGGLAVPVFASFNAASDSPPIGIRYVVLVLSLFVGLATALQQAYRFREGYEVNWRTAGAIEGEAWAFLYSTDSPYAGVTDIKQRWIVFVRRIEHLLAEWNERAISDPSTTATPAPSAGPPNTSPPLPGPANPPPGSGVTEPSTATPIAPSTEPGGATKA